MATMGAEARGASTPTTAMATTEEKKTFRKPSSKETLQSVYSRTCNMFSFPKHTCRSRAARGGAILPFEGHDPVAGSGHRTNRYQASVTKLTAGRQAAVLPRQLGEAKAGSVGPECREWVCNTLHATALPNAPSAAPEALHGGGGTRRRKLKALGSQYG